MQPRAVVFLGPSIPVNQARAVLEADYRPPARRGDIYGAAEAGAEVICLIDGVFFQDCSVAHKEIVHALEMGVKVIGASSMGALRASEMDVYGMEGVGEIYELYRQGVLDSDDEVALVFDPLSLEPISEPLVNIRHNIRLALEKGVIDSSSADTLLKAARLLYFPERSYKRTIKEARGQVPEEVLTRFEFFLESEGRDLKREDAIKALQRVRDLLERWGEGF